MLINQFYNVNKEKTNACEWTKNCLPFIIFALE